MKALRERIASRVARERSFLALSELKDNFSEAVIVGSGPTSFDYHDLKQFHSLPVVFINQTHQFSHLCPSPFKYFLTHHLWRYWDVSLTTLWIRRMYMAQHGYIGVLETPIKPKNKYISIDCQAHEIVIDDEFLQNYPWLLDKNEIIKRNRFLALYGTITTAIHFAWFCGAKKITFIGCNPKSGSFDHDPRIGGKMVYRPDYIHENTIRLPQYLKIDVEHL